jgi:hypothetical protein
MGPREATTPYIEAMLMTDASPVFSRSGAANRHRGDCDQVDLEYVRQLRERLSARGPLSRVPAVLTGTSSRPTRSVTVSMSRSRSVALARRAGTALTPSPMTALQLRESLAASGSDDDVSANRAPRPDDAPVTRATRPSSRNVRSPCQRVDGGVPDVDQDRDDR